MIRKCEKHDCEIERIYPKDGMGKFYEECPECRKEKIEKLWDIPVTDSSTVFNCPPISYCKWYLKQKEKEQKGKHEGN